MSANVNFFLVSFFCAIVSASTYGGERESSQSTLFEDLCRVEEINRRLADRLPFFYNATGKGGYFNMPSARMADRGMFGVHGASVYPYWIISGNFQPYSRIELSANYRIFREQLEKNFGHEGFGDDAERIGNVKFALLAAEDQLPPFPLISFGLDDVIGTKRFSSQYIVATEQWLKWNFEFTLGWGWGRLKGLFGGAAWTPLRQSGKPFLSDLSIVGEYDAIDYSSHADEHEKGRSVHSRFNAGLVYTYKNYFQAAISSLRGEEWSGALHISYPLGSTEGVPKVHDPVLYTCPIDREPLGVHRREEELISDLAFALNSQGLTLMRAFLCPGRDGFNRLYLKVSNTRYRYESVIHERLNHLLAALTPENLDRITVVIEADGVSTHAYTFRREDLDRFQLGKMGEVELNLLSFLHTPPKDPSPYDAHQIYVREKETWALSAHPRLLPFFGSTRGKFKYSFGLVAALEGFLYDQLFYRIQAGYSIVSTMHGLTGSDRLNPSKLLHVRTDTLKYFQTQTVGIEEAFLQMSWNLGNDWFSRLSLGYFEPAYAGGAGEFLWFPVAKPWAAGIETALLLKRRYSGLGFFNHVPKVEDGKEVEKRYVGLQYFFNLYYDFRPLDLSIRVKIGQFLARDLGARIDAIRYFSNGIRFALWLTLTNGNDHVNGKIYFDKGFALTIPFDFFLNKSSRDQVEFAMSAWLRDVGAIAQTGYPLYPLLFNERFQKRLPF